MNSLAQRLLAEIQAANFSSEDQALLAAALRPRRTGHPSPIAKWSSVADFVQELSQWAASLPAEDLPPREADAALYFGCSRRTIDRWLVDKAGIAGWEGFLRFWTLALRGD